MTARPTERWPQLATLRRMLPDGRQLRPDEFETRHRWLTAILGLHVPALMTVGLATGYTVGHLMLEVATPLSTMTLVASLRRLTTVQRAIVTTTGLTLASSVLIHLTGGLIESHFHFFVLIPLVTLYQHWTPFLVTIGWVLFHHGVVGVLDPASVYNHPAAVAAPVKWAVVHAGFVLAASLASLVAWRRNQDERERTELLLAASANPLYGREPDGTITMASRSLAELLGLEPGEVVGRSDHDLLHEGRPEDCDVCDQLAAGKAEELEDPRFSAAGRSFPVAVSSRRVAKNDKFAGVVVSFEDATLRHAYEGELRRRALYDDLTGVANRTLIIEQLSSALADMKTDGGLVGILFIDLDGFKLVNDSHGHGVGDDVLIEAARRLENLTRAGDTVGRIGGDEFVVILPALPDARLAADVAERAIALLAEPLTVHDVDLAVMASIGIRVSSDPDADPEALLRDADDAMYVSKSHSRGGFTEFDETMRSDAERQLKVSNLLRGAVARQELHLVYQPQIDGRTGELAGFEALCRWQSPELGTVPPDEFIPVAERNGSIFEIGRFVLHEATDQLAAWSAERGRRDLRMSVNVSAHQLGDRSLIDAIGSIVASNTIDPAQLVVEVTETAMIGSGTPALNHLAELRTVGVQVSIDDFGTGYSSLASLRNLPADEVKIDRAFIGGVAEDIKNQEMVRVVVAMARALGLEVAAEGAEAPADVELVRRLGCDRVQGYAVARPLSATDAGRWLTQGSAVPYR